MTDLFLYGPLRHEPLLERVLGTAVAGLKPRSATLPEHDVFETLNGFLPSVSATQGAAVEGLVLNLSDGGILEALDYYFGCFGFARQVLTVLSEDGDRTAMTYVARPEQDTGAGVWALDAWRVKSAAIALRAAEEIMAYRGRVGAPDVLARIGSLHIRAAAWVAAQKRPGDPARDLDRDVVVHRHSRSHLSFFGTEEMDLQFRRYDGRLSPVLNRSATLVGQAVVVLPYDPVRDRVLLVEQFRAATFIAGNRTPWMWEPIAGLVDPGETPEHAAQRESMEEAGISLQSLEPVAQVYSSSGSSGEFLNIFIGLTDLDQVPGGGGLDSEGEDILSRILSFDTLMQNIDAQRYQDMPLVTAALWLARHRERLRRSAGA